MACPFMKIVSMSILPLMTIVSQQLLPLIYNAHITLPKSENKLLYIENKVI